MQRLKLYHKLNMPENIHTDQKNYCCKSLTENFEALDVLDSCFELSLSLSSLEKSSLYYISGYVAFKEGYSVDIADVHGDESEFLENVSRGKLSHPPSELYDFSQYIYIFVFQRI